ncbi:MAG: HAD family hydrolase [Candidatus Zapsychrus exili]|nr:HAD family hydrolase [Candidatus Zapsychrus exili]
MIKLVIFDLDGTLVDAYKAVFESLNYSLSSLGYPVATSSDIKRSVGWGVRSLMNSFVKEEDIDKIIGIYRHSHKRSLKTGAKFMPGAKDLLKKLENAGYTMAIATNRPAWSTEVILKHLNMSKYFKYVLSGEKVKNLKPAPEILERVLEEFNLSADEAIYVGDMTIDVETANAVKMRAISVVTGSSTEDEIKALNPHKIIYNVLDVFSILEDLNEVQVNSI